MKVMLFGVGVGKNFDISLFLYVYGVLMDFDNILGFKRIYKDLFVVFFFIYFLDNWVDS